MDTSTPAPVAQLRALVAQIRTAPLLHKGEVAERAFDQLEVILAQLEERVAKLEAVAGIG